MNIPSHLKALVFDAYGTLFDVQYLNQLLVSFFPETAISINKIWRQKQLEYTWLRGQMDRYISFSDVTMDALSFALESHGLALQAEQRETLAQGYQQLRAFPDVKEVLSRLKNHLPLAVLSNADPVMLQAAIAFNHLTPFFTHVLSVDAARQFKPHPSVYALAPEHLGIAKNEIGFVSSNPWDVAGAKTFGFFTCWLKRTDSPQEKLGVEADWVLSGLSELI
ncbi:MAG: haloacid dehalogenase type II [Bacteroidota bacterium]